MARRADRSTDGLLKRKTAEWFYRLHNLVADIAIPQNVGDFRLMDRRVVDALKQLPERQRFMKGLFCWVGFKTVMLDYDRAPRAAGTSKFPGWKLWNLAIEGITSFSTAPLRIWTYVGMASAVLTALYASAILIRTLFWGVDVPGYASLLIAILFFGSLQLISLGLVGEYIGRIYIESKQRPIYIVRNSTARKAWPIGRRGGCVGQARVRARATLRRKGPGRSTLRQQNEVGRQLKWIAHEPLACGRLLAYAAARLSPRQVLGRGASQYLRRSFSHLHLQGLAGDG